MVVLPVSMPTSTDVRRVAVARPTGLLRDRRRRRGCASGVATVPGDLVDSCVSVALVQRAHHPARGVVDAEGQFAVVRRRATQDRGGVEGVRAARQRQGVRLRRRFDGRGGVAALTPGPMEIRIRC